jgi:hypothetical protein
MSNLDMIGNICAGICLFYFVVLVIYTAMDMEYLPGKSFLAKRRYKDDKE